MSIFLNFRVSFSFKGQRAPIVILVDLDESILRDEYHLGVLYCAMTRATLRLELVVQNSCPWLDVFNENI
jgi:hypothetical protein